MATDDADPLKQFIGSWSLVSWTLTSPDGTVTFPYGEDAWGRLMYLESGQMTACLMRRQRTIFASEDRYVATTAETEAAYREHMSYLARYTVDSRAGTVTHHVEAATFPNWIGKGLVRKYAFSGDRLTLRLTNSQGATSVLVWSRE